MYVYVHVYVCSKLELGVKYAIGEYEFNYIYSIIGNF